MTTATVPRILLVDDEPHILDGLRRLLRTDFAVETAVGPDIALRRIEAAGPYAVVMSDYQMPGMTGAHFLSAARQANPDTTRILLTGQADLAAAAAVVNQGGIFRLLLKPAGRDDLLAALHAGVEQYRLVTAERDLLENTLRGSVRALTEVMALANPALFARSSRLRSLVLALVRACHLDLDWQIELAAMLSDIGAIAVPSDIRERAAHGERLDAREADLLKQLPSIAEAILSGIPRIEKVREAILAQDTRYDTDTDSGVGGKSLPPFGGRVLRVARDFDDLISAGVEPAAALTRMQHEIGGYDPQLLDALSTVIDERAHRQRRSVAIAELCSGMVLAADVVTRDGLKLVAHGHEVTTSLLERIRNYARMSVGVCEPLHVYVRAPDVTGELRDAG